MRKKDLFKLFNKINGIVVATMDSFVNGNYTYTKHLCYTEDNKLFTLTQEDRIYSEDEECETYTVTSYRMGEVLSNNTIIPEFDSILKDNIYKYYIVNIE